MTSLFDSDPAISIVQRALAESCSDRQIAQSRARRRIGEVPIASGDHEGRPLCERRASRTFALLGRASQKSFGVLSLRAISFPRLVVAGVHHVVVHHAVVAVLAGDLDEHDNGGHRYFYNSVYRG
jgi:hypothetical protein